MVLADNVDGGDDLDLIVTTMNGNVFCFSTPSPHHPLKVSILRLIFEAPGRLHIGTTSFPLCHLASFPFFKFSSLLQAWRSAYQGRNNVASRYNREGIYVLPSNRNFRDEEGKNFWVEFEIVDAYRHPSSSQAPYNVTVICSFPSLALLIDPV